METTHHHQVQCITYTFLIVLLQLGGGEEGRGREGGREGGKGGGREGEGEREGGRETVKQYREYTNFLLTFSQL